MSYNVGITYKDSFGLKVVTTSSTGHIVSGRFASEFRKFYDHSLSLKTACVVCCIVFVYYLEEKCP